MNQFLSLKNGLEKFINEFFRFKNVLTEQNEMKSKNLNNF